MSRLTADLAFSVAVAERANWPVDGSDTVIAALPANADVPEAAPVPEGYRDWAVELGELLARRVGTHLHHGDFVFTTSTETLGQWGIMPEHDGCEKCEAGVAVALTYLADHPDDTMIVGHLYWASSPRSGHEEDS